MHGGIDWIDDEHCVNVLWSTRSGSQKESCSLSEARRQERTFGSGRRLPHKGSQYGPQGPALGDSNRARVELLSGIRVSVYSATSQEKVRNTVSLGSLFTSI